MSIEINIITYHLAPAQPRCPGGEGAAGEDGVVAGGEQREVLPRGEDGVRGLGGGHHQVAVPRQPAPDPVLVVRHVEEHHGVAILVPEGVHGGAEVGCSDVRDAVYPLVPENN